MPLSAEPQLSFGLTIAGDGHDLSKSPAPSFTSFSTAQSQLDADPDSPAQQPGPTLLAPPHGLRKSLSVDSFVSYSTQTRTRRANTTAEPAHALFGVSHRPIVDGHSRDSSTGSSQQSDDVHAGASGLKRRSGQMSPGELLLPSRTPSLPMGNSDGMHRIASASSLQSFTARHSAQANLTGRTRSGSLGIYLPTQKYASSSSQDKNPPTATTLVVVGLTGCGKSAIIRTGLKDYVLTEPAVSLPPGPTTMYRYSRRSSKSGEKELSTASHLNVIEIDLAASQVDAPLSIHTDVPRVDGVLICYDASNIDSFQHVEGLLQKYRAMRLSTVVLASKSDLDKQVDPQMAIEIIQQYDVGLVEVSNSTVSGREKMQRSFQWILKSIRAARRSTRNEFDDFRNPASPDMLLPPPWETTGTATPTTTGATFSSNNSGQAPGSMTAGPAETSAASTPPRMRSAGDLNPSREPAMARDDEVNGQHGPLAHAPTLVDVLNGAHEVHEDKKEAAQDLRPAQWATLDELLDKLMFLAVSGDDPTFITHFLLTYRRFAAPRNILLAMQKRMRQLDNPSGDPMFACYAQMRICNLLEHWIRDYPYDFAVRGTAGALSALVKSIISKTYLLHYGSDFLPFLELLSGLVDQDEAWAIKVDDPDEESDDSYSLLEDDDQSLRKSELIDSPEPVTKTTGAGSHTRERRSTLPLTSRTALPPAAALSAPNDHVDIKQQLRELQRVAAEINILDSEEIAQEITRMEAKLFLDIQPRHWLHYTLVSGKKDPETNSIVRFNNVSNHLGAWVVSLILCHDRTRARVRQIEKFVDVAQKLRGLNNYSALRAVVAGINSSTFSGDQTMEQFKTRSPDQAKILQSWVVLLQHIRSHRAYRLALRNTKGACIPALEVHMSDLIRSHEGNVDFHESDPTKVHWGKFNMMGRFISSTTQCQVQCRATVDYNFPERAHIRELLQTSCVMDEEMQSWRISPQEDEEPRHKVPREQPTPHHLQHKDPAKIRRLFFW